MIAGVGAVEIVQLLVSGIHRYEGRPADGPLPAPPGEVVDSVALRAGLGIVGDRYFAKAAHRNAAVTIMAAEHLPPAADLVQLRRNVLLRGTDVDALVGSVFTLDSGAGTVRLRADRAANPCGWLDFVIGPGTRAGLRGRGGVRCEVLSGGTLRVGPVELEVQR